MTRPANESATSSASATATTNDAQAPRPGSGDMFDGIAPRYDLLNRVMSFGMDRRWRRKTVEALELGPGARVLDLATGTADVAMSIARSHPECEVVGVDPSAGMLDIGREKIASEQLEDRVSLALGDAQELDYPDDSFDGVCIAFGIRNVPDRARALAEMARITRPGGRVAILELSEPRRGLIAPLARFHIHHLVPRLGAMLSGSNEYRYLQSSIAAFPPPESFADMMRAAGMDVLLVKPMSFGACHLYVGTPAPSQDEGAQTQAERDPA
ncbi:bifunctional demethylmenaquinone methyltransferase/2-methoxy-6-polyprenyl-1,4-benzoquinol methylase UbiE [Haliangium ochraceum]|uniref:Demethylmenaquinone methyltransferase n=1 Tax=Haliangium ochraceum (strain DSM 14365 / JCM 11303 / SMP-2) TaxID=502025 RepID=D0LH47_HALO1|nr:bifunctional demethylmenaquinone methyltransferase/2-methoxy-6-polyprenyl-1,4-benzoquinol methylase UbiE [Haliangium ochraceum]ACY18192.1 ubiquinone/menaquinone biosynthesis methyltransferase [Haliangium ochraceum DSM 14365]